MMTNPCQFCNDRSITCHGTCSKYAEFRKWMDECLEKRKIECQKKDYGIPNCRRRRKIMYRIIGKFSRCNHQEMIQNIGKTMYAIQDNEIVPIHIDNIIIDFNTGKWRYTFMESWLLNDDELIFVSIKSAERYLRKIKK